MESFNVVTIFVAMVGVIGAASVALTLALKDRRLDVMYGEDEEIVARYRRLGGE
jgi:hypothetical protein